MLVSYRGTGPVATKLRHKRTYRSHAGSTRDNAMTCTKGTTYTFYEERKRKKETDKQNIEREEKKKSVRVTPSRRRGRKYITTEKTIPPEVDLTYRYKQQRCSRYQSEYLVRPTRYITTGMQQPVIRHGGGTCPAHT